MNDDLPAFVAELREWDEPVMHRAAYLIERLDRITAALSKQLSQSVGRNARAAKLMDEHADLDRIRKVLLGWEDKP